MTVLSQQRCFNHGFREAVARCPECGRYYCRECITEHEDRVLCAACLSKSVGGEKGTKRALGRLRDLASFFVGVSLIWLVFFYLGRMLVALPSSFHDGTLWKDLW